MAENPEKRVLILNYEYPPLGGGAANATKNILESFSLDRKIIIDLVTSSSENTLTVTPLASNITIHFLPIGRKEGDLHHQSVKNLLVYSWKSFWYSLKLLRREKYNVIHAFFSVPSGFIALILSKMFSVPYIVSLRGSDVPGYSERFKKFYPFLRPISRIIWKQAKKVVANSQGLKELALESAPHQEILVIPNGVNTNIFTPGNEEKSDCIITTGATRITKRKGLRYLLESLLLLQEKYPHVRVEIMGEGSEKESLINYVRENSLETKVSFLGRIPAEETFQYYQRASIFVLPSFNEGMSNALLEALASGLPAIVTKTGGSEELVTEGLNGLYIQKQSSESIARALETLLENENLRKQMSRESRSLAETLGWEKVAKLYKELY